MAKSGGSERILIVESNQEIRDLIARQALGPLGYQVKTAPLASTAIQLSLTFNPDLIITNLHLPDLSGKDLLVALSSQGVDIPIILTAEKGMESDIIQAFRLGASDYLTWPIREAEVVSAVERALKNIRERRERVYLERQVKQTGLELQRKVRELTTIFSLGKAVTSPTDQHALLNQIMEGALFVSEADRGWLLLRDDRQRTFLLRAYLNLPKTVVSQLNQPFDDGVSSLVALSGEVLSIHGAALQRFKIAQWGQAAMVIPIKAKKEVVGLLTVVRKEARPFDKNAQSLLEAVADYASISLVNARLFQALEDRASRLEKAIQAVNKSEGTKTEIIRHIQKELDKPVADITRFLDQLAAQEHGKVTKEQQKVLEDARERIGRVAEVTHSISALHEAASPKQLTTVDLADVIRQALAKYQKIAQKAGLALVAELPHERTFITVDTNQMLQVFGHLLDNAIKFSQNSGQVTIRMAATNDNMVHVLVEDHGIGISPKHIAHIFDRFYQADDPNIKRLGGLGIGLTIVKEIVEAHNGQVAAESELGRGTKIMLTLPRVAA